MRKLSFVVAAAALLLTSTAHAAELFYRWKKGATYRFTAESHDDVAMNAMGMKMGGQFVTRSTFAIKVDAVKPDGSAKGKLFVESFEVKNAQGARVAGLDSIPAEALKTLVEIDAKGRFTIKEQILMVIDDDGESTLVSASAKAGPTGGSATSRVGDQEVTVWAKFDPKTGKLSSGYSEKTVGQKPKKTKLVEKDADKTKLNVLPTSFLELLALPAGDVAKGGKAKADMAAAGAGMSLDVDVTVGELTAERAHLKTTVRSKMSADTKAMPKPAMPASPSATATVTAHTDDEDGETTTESQAEVQMQMPAMGAMPGMGEMGAMPGMAGAPGAPLGGDMSMDMKIDGDFDLDFAVREGMIDGIQGTLVSETKMGGAMSMTTKCKLTMKRVR